MNKGHKDFESSLETMLDGMNAVEKMGREDRKARTLVLGSLSAVCMFVAVGFGYSRWKTPEDTFTDPMLAYAQVEQSLEEIFNKMSGSNDLLREAGDKLEKPGEMIKEMLK